MTKKNDEIMAYLATLSKKEIVDFLTKQGLDLSKYPVGDDGYPDIIGIAQKKDGSLIVYVA